MRRVGVSFTDAQKDLIKSLTNTGRIAEAQEIILKALNTQVGGAGIEAAKGLAGAIDTLTENITIFFEESKIGRAIVDGLTRSLNFLGDAFGNADKEAKALSSIVKIEAERTRLLKEQATLNTDNDDPESTALTADQKRYNEILDLLKKLNEQENKIRKDRAQAFSIVTGKQDHHYLY